MVMRCTHFVGFRDDRYWNAVRIWGRPNFVHRWWDKRAQREIAPEDIVVFADGDWRQPPHKYNAPDIEEDHGPLQSTHQGHLARYAVPGAGRAI